MLDIKEINNKNKYILEHLLIYWNAFLFWSTKYNLKKITRCYIRNNNFMYYASIIDIKYYDLLIKEFKASKIAGIIYITSCDKLILVCFYVLNKKFMNVSCCIDANYLTSFNDRLIYKEF